MGVKRGNRGARERRPGNRTAAQASGIGSGAGVPAWKVWLPILGLLLATMLAYYPAWHGGMLWDDDMHVTRPELRSTAGLYRIWFDVGATLQYYPLLHSAFWLEHKLWGDATFGYHLVNIFLHVAAALMIGWILRRLKVPGAWLAAAVFALHPVQVESVAWITELKNTLSAVFYLGAVMLYLRFDEKRSRTVYAAAFSLFALAMMTKTVAGTLPGALLVLFWWKRGRILWKKDLVPLVPFFALGAGGGMITAWWELRINRCVGPDFEFTLLQRFLIAGKAVWFHLGKLVLPSDLSFIYPRWEVRADALQQYVYPVGLLVLAALLWSLRHRSRAPLAALLFFCGTLFPTLGFFNLYTFRYSLVANHYQYLACAGIIALASAGAALLLDRIGARHLRVGYALSLGLVAVLAGLTWRESRHYVDAETLYLTTLSRNPGCWLALNNLGVLKLDTSLPEAVSYMREALQIHPAYPEAHSNLGNALQKMGRYQEAVAEYREALKLNPELANAHGNLGNALLKLGLREEAAAEYESSLRINPGLVEARNNLGNVLQELGRFDEAVVRHEETLAIDPDFAEAHRDLGSALQQLGRLEEAVAQYEQALRLKPEFAEAHSSLCGALQQLGRLEEAEGQCQAALRLNPDLEDAHYNLGNVYQSMNRPQDAAVQFRAALRVNPESAGAHNNLGVALEDSGRPEEAAAQYREALRLQPDFTRAHSNLGKLLQDLGRNGEAADQFREALKYEPGSAESHNNLGAVLGSMGRISEAVAQFREALRLDPNYQEAKDNLNRALALIGK